MRWRVCKEGKDKFWKLDRLDALVIDRSGAVAAGGWTEDAEIWVAGGGRGKGWVVGVGMRGAWIGGRATEAGVDDFLCVNPRCFVDDIL